MKANLLRAVKSALARAPAPSVHPDANLLAGFAENTLGARERADVAAHLADCVDCREFVMLAFSTVEDETIEPARATVPRRRWNPVWSWAGSMAAVCIVVSAVWEYRIEHLPPVEPPPAPAVIGAPTPAATGITAPVAATPASVPAASQRAALKEKKLAPPVVASAASNMAVAKPTEPPPPATAAAPTPPPPPVVKDEAADAISATPPPPPPEQTRKDLQAQATSQFVEKGALASESAAEGRAKSAPVTASGFAGAPARMRSLAKVAARPESHVRWTIGGTPGGVLQRSDDGGTTWRDVQPGDGVSFRTVVSNGADVWAGGLAGALFHSSDAGAHWQRVTIDVTGAVVEIRADGAGEVSIVTDAEERRTSADNGRTWH